MPPLILASSSINRAQLLQRLELPFTAISPHIDETPLPAEVPGAMVLRLARQKAEAVDRDYPVALIIGCDQCAVVEGEIMGKPGDHGTAFRQLKAAAGKAMRFHTGLCLLDTASGEAQVEDAVSTVWFRPLTDAQIGRYLQKERPYGCAGSIKAESLGIALFERIETEDPNAIIGLPLIRLVSMLKNAGVEVL